MITTSKNPLSISTLLLVCFTGACASGAQNLHLESSEEANLTELANVRASGSTRALTARARGPVRLRQRQTQGRGATASAGASDELRRFQPATRGTGGAPSTSCQPDNGLKRFGERTQECHLINSQHPTR